MCNSISLQSIKKANGRLMHRQSSSFTTDGTTAKIHCHTIYGSSELSIPTDKIIHAANNALKQ